jgi:hypothetical protein
MKKIAGTYTGRGLRIVKAWEKAYTTEPGSYVDLADEIKLAENISEEEKEVLLERLRTFFLLHSS